MKNEIPELVIRAAPVRRRLLRELGFSFQHDAPVDAQRRNQAPSDLRLHQRFHSLHVSHSNSPIHSFFEANGERMVAAAPPVFVRRPELRPELRNQAPVSKCTEKCRGICPWRVNKSPSA
jgi:hypothetical protein